MARVDFCPVYSFLLGNFNCQGCYSLMSTMWWNIKSKYSWIWDRNAWGHNGAKRRDYIWDGREPGMLGEPWHEIHHYNHHQRHHRMGLHWPFTEQYICPFVGAYQYINLWYYWFKSKLQFLFLVLLYLDRTSFHLSHKHPCQDQDLSFYLLWACSSVNPWWWRLWWWWLTGIPASCCRHQIWINPH